MEPFELQTQFRTSYTPSAGIYPSIATQTPGIIPEDDIMPSKRLGENFFNLVECDPFEPSDLSSNGAARQVFVSVVALQAEGGPHPNISQGMPVEDHCNAALIVGICMRFDTGC